MVVKCNVLPNSYYDSATLMLATNRLAETLGAGNVAVMMATDANREIMETNGLLVGDAMNAGPSDLVLTVRAADETAAVEALTAAKEALHNRVASVEAQGDNVVRTLDSAFRMDPATNMVVISVPGEYARGEASRALDAGRHVMLFSDNVPVEDELALKQQAREKGLLMMGPDCGTALIGGAALCFANVVPRGSCGIVAAAGTGLQEVSTIIARIGGGVSQGIGTGGRDVKEKIGGIMMLAGIDALDGDDATEVIVIVSKPPAASVEQKILERLRQASKPAVVCFLGSEKRSGSEDAVHYTASLAEAAVKAVELSGKSVPPVTSLIDVAAPLAEEVTAAASLLAPSQRNVRALFTGGTLCYEALVLATDRLDGLRSNTPLLPEQKLSDSSRSEGHCFLDLGEDEFTRGRPHPMIDPTPRNARLIEEAADPSVAVILMDVVIGYGSHGDPAGSVAEAVNEARSRAKADGREMVVVASVCGTAGDFQDYAAQRQRLVDAGVIVAETNAQAVAVTLAVVATAKGGAQ